ncbi:OmpA family protein [Membranihabitans marinus]
MSAQPLSEIPLAFKIEAADTAYANHDYYNALEWYNEVYRESRSDEYLALIAKLYYTVRDYKRGEQWHRRLLDKHAAGSYKTARLNYGKILKANGKYNEAAIVFQEIEAKPESDSILQVAKLELKGITLAESLKRPDNIEVNNVGTKLNTRNSETSPVPVTNGQLYFISFGENKLLQRGDDELNMQAKIFTSKINDSGEFTKKAQAVDGILQGEEGHIGNVFVSEDGRRMYFTYFTLHGSKLASSTVYHSTSSGRGWSSPKRVNGLPVNGIVKNPSLGSILGKEVLFYSYNGGGSKGGYDIFYSPLASPTEASSVVPLGEEINTSGNEISPIFYSNTLYFSTDGHPSIGGFDIYSALWTGESWAKVENIGKGVNSTLDESYYFPSINGNHAYLVSNREGTRSVQSSTCCDDIYQLDNKEIIIRLLASVQDGDNPLNQASISIFPVVDNEWGSPDVQYNADGHEFTFSIDADKAYQVLVSREGYVSDTVAFNTVGVKESKDFRGVFKLKKLPEVEESTSIAMNEPIRLNNIYYDFDDDKIKMEAEADLDFLYDLLLEYPTMVIELSSHTDSRGTDSYNLDLSQRRANSAKSYLVAKGIESGRIKAVGYGENLILNHCTNGVDCSDEEHLLNRRTEFKIIAGPQTIQIKKEKDKVRKRDNEDEGSLSPQKGQPLMKFEKPSYDLGSVKLGDKITTEIPFTNAGNAPLLIEVASGCECSTLDWTRSPILPGKSGKIELIFDSTDQPLGLQDKTIDVLANTNPPITSIQFKVQIN